jgi:hypothetical protein
MTIDELSGAELDALAATSVMGWHRPNGNNFPGEHRTEWLDASGEHHDCIDCFRPSEESEAMLTVLLKALGEVRSFTAWQKTNSTDFHVAVEKRNGYWTYAFAPTLPIALVRAICKAVKP